MPRRRVHVEIPITSRRLTVDEILDGRPGREDAAADAWLDLRRVLSRAEHQHPLYDPRKAMVLSPGPPLARWREARRAWVANLMRDDPRVEHGDAT